MSLISESSQLYNNQPSVLYEFFQQSAQRWPNAIAVDVPPSLEKPHRRRISYAELERKSNMLAQAVYLETGCNLIVAIFLPRTTEWLYVAQLAILRSASAYVCIDPTFPDEQINYILHDSSATILLTDTEGAERARQIDCQIPILQVDQPFETSTARLPPLSTPESIAYIIYTSGSTGMPKGVMISHGSIVNLISGDITEFSLGPGDRVAQGSAAAYDSSVEEIWMALASGATVVVMDDNTVRLGPDLVRWLRDECITILCPPPTLLRTMGCKDPQMELTDLRLLYVGGEALPPDIAERWSRGRRMVNGYGPTECTVTCLRHDIVSGKNIAIGHPVPGMQAWILNDDLKLVPNGEIGELCMSGAGIAIGYLNRPELNSSKFLHHPQFGRIYRTGDLAHVEPNGTLYYHGRIDSQVKLRGYRIELEAIESCLVRCPGVREAACRVQGEGALEILAAHVILTDPASLLNVDELKSQLLKSLPRYMIPSVFGTIKELPKNPTSGKLRRSDLPILAIERHQSRTVATPLCDPIVKDIAEAVRNVLNLPNMPSVNEDFFIDLGGSSLTAAMLITELRMDPKTASITVRDLYEARTIEKLACRATPPNAKPNVMSTEQSNGNPINVTLVQLVWLLLELIAGSALGYISFFWFFPWLSSWTGLIVPTLLMPFLFIGVSLVFVLLSFLIAIGAKRILIGQYTPIREPVWSGFYVRMWIVRQFMRLIPWNTIAGTEFQCIALRALGAHIGKRVHIHRGVNLLNGGWDLLYIGDDVTISQDAIIGLVQLEKGQVVIGPVKLENGATMDVRSGVGPNTQIGHNAWLTALSWLLEGDTIPAGEKWDGVPAKSVGIAPKPPMQIDAGKCLSPILHGTAMILSQSLLRGVLYLPYALAFILVSSQFNLNTYDLLLSAIIHPTSNLILLLSMGVAMSLATVCMVSLEAIVARAIGTVSPGVISRWSWTYIRVWLKPWLVTSAGSWLSGGLFWPVWLRAAGMKIGHDCEISTIIDVVPELIKINSSCFLADGIYLGGPRIQCGTVTLGNVFLERNTFLGNHVVVAAGQQLPQDILIGISTVADDRVVRPGSSWFGHPPFELPRREIVAVDRSLTYDPPFIRVVNRVFWEWLRFTLPILLTLETVLWIYGVNYAKENLSLKTLLMLGVPTVSLMTIILLLMFVLGLKWLLLGRVHEGTHPLWSCWCSRWDFLYVFWGVIARNLLSFLEGTLLLSIYLRCMGMNIGKGVVLGEGFSQVVDPDMLSIGNGATVSAMFQAHTFEDRVLKIGHIQVGAYSTLGTGTVPLYGANIGMHTFVLPNSVIMKREHLQPWLRYEGAPTRRQYKD
jgi:non-ribosomal peptide synthetase-like protein